MNISTYVTVFPYVKVNVIQSGINLWMLLARIIMLRLNEICQSTSANQCLSVYTIAKGFVYYPLIRNSQNRNDINLLSLNSCNIFFLNHEQENGSSRL